MPCWLYLGDVKVQSRHLWPEMQVEACHDQYKTSDVGYIMFDSFELSEESGSAWLPRPLGSMYR